MIVVVVIVALAGLLFMLFLPRQREVARLAACQKNLMQIGRAVALYDQDFGSLPFIVALNDDVASRATGPLYALLRDLAIPDFRSIPELPNRPEKHPSLVIAERRLADFICPSDSNAFAGIHVAPVSYRATTGDEPDGRDGAFAPGRKTSLESIEASDGLSFTALFAERLVGNGQQASPLPFNYALIGRAVSAEGCGTPPPTAWHGDAGAAWALASWRSTLYNHVLTPNAAPSCISDSGQTALMGSSSGHQQGVNVLFGDLGIRTFSSRTDPAIWREWARFDSSASRSENSQAPN